MAISLSWGSVGTIELSPFQKSADLMRHDARREHRGMTHPDGNVIAHTRHHRLRQCNHAIVRRREVRRDEPSQSFAARPGDNTDFAVLWWQTVAEPQPFFHAPAQNRVPAR